VPENLELSMARSALQPAGATEGYLLRLPATLAPTRSRLVGATVRGHHR
jgi:hypothetical protein